MSFSTINLTSTSRPEVECISDMEGDEVLVFRGDRTRTTVYVHVNDGLKAALRRIVADWDFADEADARTDEWTGTPDVGKDAWQLDAETLQASGFGTAGVDF